MGSRNVFASVKSYSKRGKLLSRDDLQTLAESRDLDELVTRIRNTAYAGAVSSVEKPYTSHGIESAVRGHLAGIHHAIALTAGGVKLLDAYYLRFTVSNLKHILKGKALGRSQEEIEAHVNLRAEELAKRRDTVVKALVAKDLDEAVAALSHAEFGGDAARAAALYADKKNPQVFDAHLDRVLYTRISRSLKSAGADAAKLASMDVDSYNMLAVVRGKFWGLDEQQVRGLLVDQSPAASELLGRMIAAGTVRDALAELAGTRYKGMVPQSEGELDMIAEFERALEAAAYGAARRSFSKMLSLVTTVGITKLTAYEARNLAAIAYAVEQGIPASTTMPRLVLEA